MEMAAREGASVQVRQSAEHLAGERTGSVVTAKSDLMEDHHGKAVHRETMGGSGWSRAVGHGRQGG